MEPAAPVGNLNDFTYQDGTGKDLHIEVSVKDNGQVAIFHNKPFVHELGWLEFDLGTNQLEFVRDDGEMRDFGFALTPDMAKHMQNTHHVFMVLMDEESGEPAKGGYLPLIVHRKELP